MERKNPQLEAGDKAEYHLNSWGSHGAEESKNLQKIMISKA